MTEIFQKTLLSGIEKLSIKNPDNFYISNSQLQALLNYHQLLIKWNKAYNLTAVRDPQTMIVRHILDSLSIVPFLRGENFIDIGTGAGIPGIILAIIFPEYNFDLLDSNGKKTRFLFQVKTDLALSNVNIINQRVEQFQTEKKYQGILSRAFSTLTDMAEGSCHLVADNGYFYAMKGIYPEDEMKDLCALKKGYTVEACHSLEVPGDSGDRHLVVFNC